MKDSISITDMLYTPIIIILFYGQKANLCMGVCVHVCVTACVCACVRVIGMPNFMLCHNYMLYNCCITSTIL